VRDSCLSLMSFCPMLQFNVKLAALQDLISNANWCQLGSWYKSGERDGLLQQVKFFLTRAILKWSCNFIDCENLWTK
jgi:hypothetical protein